jgi:hypothetical protein
MPEPACKAAPATHNRGLPHAQQPINQAGKKAESALSYRAVRSHKPQCVTTNCHAAGGFGWHRAVQLGR